MWRRKMLCVSQVVLLRRESTTDAQHADSVGTHVFVFPAVISRQSRGWRMERKEKIRPHQETYHLLSLPSSRYRYQYEASVIVLLSPGPLSAQISCG